MTALNVATDPWVAVADAEGNEASIPPWQVGTDSTWTRFAFPRPDLNGIATELTLALHQTIAPPPDEESWRRGPNGPDERQVRAAFEEAARWFSLAGEHPFLQDPSLDTDKPESLSYLDPMRPGRNTWMNDKDHFVRHEQDLRLPQSHAALLLYAQQAWSPTKGGAGHYSGTRGNSPSVSLLRLARLRDTVWANLVPAPAEPVKAWLPWTQSEPWGPCAPMGDDVREQLWRMPRRYRLVLEGGEAVSFVRAPKGQQHGEGWSHPYTPRAARKDGGSYPVAGARYERTHRDHVAVTLGTTHVEPSLVVRHNRDRAWREGDVRVWTFGYRYNGTVVLGWLDHDVSPLRLDERHVKEARGLLEGAVSLEEQACGAVRHALKADGSGVLLGGAARHRDGSAQVYADVRRRVESATQPIWNHLMSPREELATGDWYDLMHPWGEAVQDAAVQAYRDMAAGISKVRRGEAYHAGLLTVKRMIKKARKEAEGG